MAPSPNSIRFDSTRDALRTKGSTSGCESPFLPCDITTRFHCRPQQLLFWKNLFFGNIVQHHGRNGTPSETHLRRCLWKVSSIPYSSKGSAYETG